MGRRRARTPRRTSARTSCREASCCTPWARLRAAPRARGKEVARSEQPQATHHRRISASAATGRCPKGSATSTKTDAMCLRNLGSSPRRSPPPALRNPRGHTTPARRRRRSNAMALSAGSAPHTRSRKPRHLARPCSAPATAASRARRRLVRCRPGTALTNKHVVPQPGDSRASHPSFGFVALVHKLVHKQTNQTKPRKRRGGNPAACTSPAAAAAGSALARRMLHHGTPTGYVHGGLARTSRNNLTMHSKLVRCSWAVPMTTAKETMPTAKKTR